MHTSPSTPSTSDSIGEFLARSPCPFAQRAAVLHAGPWLDTRLLDRRIDDLHRELLAVGRRDDLDLLVLEIQRADRLQTPQEAAGLLHGVLDRLRARDSTRVGSLTDGIESPGWDFQHAGEKLFISFFAPFYPSAHSRFSGHESTGFILFQPESSFRRFGVSSRHPRREQLARTVHRRFQQRGQDYDVEGNGLTPKAMRFVKPLHGDEPPIAWWRVPYEAETG